MRKLLSPLIVLACLVFAAEAGAHAVLLATEPADRAVLADAPRRITLTFNEAVAPVALRLVDGGGTPIALGPVETADTNLTAAIPESLAPGPYILSFRVTSADSHPVSGSVVFAVGAPPAVWAAEPPQANEGFTGWPLWSAINRFLTLAAGLSAAGAALFLVFVAGGTDSVARRLAGSAAAVGIASALAAVGLQGALLAEAPPVALLGADTWALGVNSTRGLQCLVLAAGLAALLAGLAVSGRPGRWTAAAGALSACASFPLSGHVAASGDVVLPAALALHVTVGAFWLGSLPPLLLALCSGDGQAFGLARRFSAIAVVAVPVLLAAGIWLAADLVGGLAALWSTPYGWLLLAKGGLVCALLALAAANRLRFMPRLRTRASDVRKALRRSIAAEIALGTAIVAVTVVLSQTPHGMPAGTAHDHHHAGHEDEEYAVAISRGGRALLLTIARLGDGHVVEAAVSLEGGEPLAAAQEATLVLSRPDLGIEPLRRPMRAIAPGRFRHEGTELTLAGRWHLRLDVLIGDFEMAAFETELPALPRP